MSTAELLPDLKVTTKSWVLVLDRHASTLRVIEATPAEQNLRLTEPALSVRTFLVHGDSQLVMGERFVLSVSTFQKPDEVLLLTTGPVVSIAELKVYETESGGWP